MPYSDFDNIKQTINPSFENKLSGLTIISCFKTVDIIYPISTKLSDLSKSI